MRHDIGWTQFGRRQLAIHAPARRCAGDTGPQFADLTAQNDDLALELLDARGQFARWAAGRVVPVVGRCRFFRRGFVRDAWGLLLQQTGERNAGAPPINAPKAIEKSFDMAAMIPITAPITANITLIASLFYCLKLRDPFVARINPRLLHQQYGENRRAEYHVNRVLNHAFEPLSERSRMVMLICRCISIFRRLYATYFHRINPWATDDEHKRGRIDRYGSNTCAPQPGQSGSKQPFLTPRIQCAQHPD
jgi:hypothetical protein